MNASTASVAGLIQSAADWVFMPWVIAVLLGTGLFLTLRTGAVQVRRFSDAWRVAFVRKARTKLGWKPNVGFDALTSGSAIAVMVERSPPFSPCGPRTCNETEGHGPLSCLSSLRHGNETLWRRLDWRGTDVPVSARRPYRLAWYDRPADICRL